MISIDMREMINNSSWDSRQVQSVDMKPDYGSGCLSEVRSLQNGISVVVQDFSLHGDEKIRLTREDSGPDVIAFFTCLSGVAHIAYEKHRISLGESFSNIYFPEYRSARFMEVKCNTPVRTLLVCMDITIFSELTGRDSSELIESLELLDWSYGKRRAVTRLQSLDLAQRICGYQAFDSFMNSPSERLFLEAKALEMAALQLRQLDHLTGKTPQIRKVDPHREKIFQACDVLKSEMANPPAARELARRVGLNHNQLVRGFRKMLGLCPFEYLRIQRLEKARHLISSNECNVTEAAFRVGYGSSSHFTRSFQKEFGISPKAFAGESKKRY